MQRLIVLLVLAGSLLAPAAVSAQTASADALGITTIGFGEASAPAESAHMQFIVINESYFGGPPQLPQAEATPGAAARATVAPIADAIAAIEGVENVVVEIPLAAGPYGGPAPVARIELTVANPDLERLTALVTAATQAAAAERLLVSHAGARFDTSDCDVLEREARQAAVDDARRQAEIQADVLGVGLGDVVAAADVNGLASAGFSPYGIPVGSSSGCDPELAAGSIGDPNLGITLPAFDPTSDSGEVEVYRQVQVTFAIDATAATPAA